jgi:6-phosphofructokinase 1
MARTERQIAVDRLGEPRFPSPLRRSREPGLGLARFVAEGTWARDVIAAGPDAAGEELLFEKAGPRDRLFFDPKATRAAVVTCGGLCPGLNNVVRSLFLELHFEYGVAEVLGVRDGYLGLNPDRGRPPLRLTREFVSDIHHEGGTFLGTSRGPQDVGVMLDFLGRERVNVLFCVGGDGTQRGAHALAEEAHRRGMPLAVVGIPKTIDCDILYCDRTFGYSTAVAEAQRVIHLAHTEARSCPRGVGLVKLMGREAGFIACGATLVSQEANFTLIPEVPFELHGEGGLLAALGRRLDERRHAVLVVAEGAGQHLFGDAATGRDASGNPKLHDIGPHLKREIVAHFEKLGRPADVKYIDPSYIIRSVPANSEDAMLCDGLARHAAHAAMAGRSGLMIGLRHGAFIHVPLPMAVAGKRRVDPEGNLWAAVLQATGQPTRFGP